MKDEFIELDRHFAAIPAGLKLQDDDDIRRAVGLAATLRWDDLISRHRVVILAEPGAGKTREIQNAAERLRSEKRTAFYLKLEHVAQNLEQAFDIGTFEEFEDWKCGSGEAWFFLDSVDEAKLADPRDFDKAVRRFANAISGHGQRAHLYLTSRLHEWRWESDAALVTSKFPFKPLAATPQGQQSGPEAGRGQSSRGTQKRENKEERDLLIVALAPLTGEQMLRFAKQRDVLDATELIGEIERKDAALFASRPLDLQELIDYWLLHKAIGSREELVRASIDAKLRELDSDRARLQPLTEKKGRVGARQLAAATTFQRRSRIVLPGSESSRPGVLASALLPEWELFQVGTLLGRPLFDDPIYGTVRFHHRLIREYLTAEWLHELLIDGKSRRAVEALLFTEQYGVEMVFPIARAVVPWLALKDDRIRAKCLEVAPDVLMEGGDPSRLPYEVRAGILKRFCAEQAGRTRGHRSFDAAAIQRFSHDDLAGDISQLISTHVLDQEVVEVLLTLVWQGRLRGCFEHALACATDTRMSNAARITAIRASVATCPRSDVEKTRDKILASIRDQDQSLLAAAIAELGPALLPVSLLFSVIDRLTPPRRFSYRSLDSMMPRYVADCDLGMLRSFVQSALQRLHEEPHIERRLFEVSQKNVWLLPYAGAACERLVQSRHDDALSEPVVAVISLMAAGEHHHDFRRGEHKLRELVPAWRELNYRLFWHDVAEARRELDEKRGERLTEFWQARIFREFTSFTADDFDTVVASIKSRDLIDDKLVALSLAFALYVNAKRPRKWREKLKRAVAGIQELKDALQRHLHPPAPSADVKRFKQSERAFARRSKERERQQEERAKKWRSWLKQHLHVLRDASLAPKGSVWNATMYLLEAQRKKKESNSRWGESNWQGLSSEFGADVARAHRDGLVAYWRGFRPTLRSEGVDNPNSIPNAIIVGLSGLEIEARETDGWAASLSEDDARLATRYALWEMNGFPEWLPALHTAHREAVREILLAEMQWEITAGHNANTGGYVISDLRPYGDWLAEDVAPDLLRMISEAAPASEQTTSDILSIILGSKSVMESDVVTAAKLHAEQIQDTARQALWLAAWIGFDADSGLNALEAALSSRDPAAATDLAMRLAVALMGNGRGAAIGANGNYKAPQLLLKLHQLLHAHIKRQEDIDRSNGGGDSPTLRDDAQEARDRVFGILREIPGKETYLSLLAIAETYADEPNTKMWIEHHARSKAESDADARTRAWTSDDVLTFNNERERKPATHRELYDLMRSRLEELKLDLEHGDSSVAPILWRSGEETEHRVFIGRELRNQSLGRYAVPQEEELADEKRPDIRIHAAGVTGAVPIELKISDKWTGAQLFERLINQLCGDYLRDDRSSCGIYLLMYRGVGRKSWDIPSGERVGFVQLIQELQKAADAHIAGIAKIDSITVIGMDLTVRTSKSKVIS